MNNKKQTYSNHNKSIKESNQVKDNKNMPKKKYSSDKVEDKGQAYQNKNNNENYVETEQQKNKNNNYISNEEDVNKHMRIRSDTLNKKRMEMNLDSCNDGPSEREKKLNEILDQYCPPIIEGFSKFLNSEDTIYIKNKYACLFDEENNI